MEIRYIKILVIEISRELSLAMQFPCFTLNLLFICQSDQYSDCLLQENGFVFVGIIVIQVHLFLLSYLNSLELSYSFILYI